MSDFINNLSKNGHEEKLRVVLQMDNYSIAIEGGIVHVAFPNLTESTGDCMGDVIPGGLEYITIKNITMMKYCGHTTRFGFTKDNSDLYCTVNSIIDGHIVGVAESAYDEPSGKPMCGTAATLSSIIEILFRSTEAESKYVNGKCQVINLKNYNGEIFGTGYRMNNYIAVEMEASDEVYWYYGGQPS